jgi:Lysozyme like domain/LysM domain
MTAGRSEHRSLKIRRRGRHTAPSQVEKVTEKAGKAAPAMAIAGALVAAPQAQHAFATSAKPAAVSAAGTHRPAAAGQQAPSATATLDSISSRGAPASNTHYKVRSGDTLSGIAQHFYHRAADWQWLYHENTKTLSDPNLIFPGQTLFVPADPPANYTLSDYVPKHAKPAAPVSHRTSSGGGGVADQAAPRHGSGGGSGSLSGRLSCSGLESLWDSAGGNPADAHMAAEIAMAESGGNQYAHSPTDDFGYWQINASNGPLATYDAFGNARAAITLSHNGSNWSAWTTYTSGAYAGRC